MVLVRVGDHDGASSYHCDGRWNGIQSSKHIIVHIDWLGNKTLDLELAQTRVSVGVRTPNTLICNDWASDVAPIGGRV